MFLVAARAHAQASLPEAGAERNVALASFGTTVRVDSEWMGSPFVDGGETASHLIDGIRNDVSSKPEFSRWHSALNSQHPHWIWLHFPVPCAIRRVVLWRTTLTDYPVEIKVSYLSGDRSHLINIVDGGEVEFPLGRMDLTLDFSTVVTDNVRLVILRSSNKEFPDYAQLSELEILGRPSEPEAVGKPMPFDAPGKDDGPVPPPRTEPGKLPDGLRAQDSADRITFESASQRLTLSKFAPRILEWRVDGFGEGRFRKNILTLNGVAPCFIAFGRDACRPLPSAAYSRKGNVITYGEVALSDVSRMQWTVTILPEGFTIASTERRTRETTDASLARFDFDAAATPSCPLGELEAHGALRFPVFLTVPDFGSYLVTARASWGPAFWRFGADPLHRRFSLDAGRAQSAEGPTVLPPATETVTLELRVAEAYPLARCLGGQDRFRGLRRAWMNIFQLRPDIGILSNNVVSQNCIFCLYEYADVALYSPELPGELSAMDIVRASLDAYLDGADGYGKPSDGFIDSEPSLLIAAWDYYVATGDRAWLSRRVRGLERIACDVLSRKERDGLLESVLTGNSYSFRWASNWWDVISFGHKDAYANALTYRALMGLADLENELERKDKAAEFSEAARWIREDFVATFYNPRTGVLAGWKSADGDLHDYYFTFISGIAIAYGLVPDDIANDIVDRMQAKFREVGYRSFQYGLPGNLAPIARKDYVPGRAGSPQRDDGSDTFQQYENGAASGNFAYFYLQALYKLGRRDEADRILFPMLEAYDRGTFQDGVGSGVDWKTWEGKACGYEGMLVDNYYPLLAVLTGYLGIEHDMAGVRLRSDSPLVGRKVDWNIRHLGRPVTLPSSSDSPRDCLPASRGQAKQSLLGVGATLAISGPAPKMR
jgi:Bacterial alpha-L-rhamnosidase 6 hairpin glycosidase domain